MSKIALIGVKKKLKIAKDCCCEYIYDSYRISFIRVLKGKYGMQMNAELEGKEAVR